MELSYIGKCQSQSASIKCFDPAGVLSDKVANIIHKSIQFLPAPRPNPFRCWQ